MATHRQSQMMAFRGEMPGLLPYAPRIDLWYNANASAGTLPVKHLGRTQDEISRAEGWALHKVVPDYMRTRHPDDNLHRAIGLFRLKELVYGFRFSGDIEIEVEREGTTTRVKYDTPLGTVSTTTIYTEEMKTAGASITWVEEHIIKRPEDYRIVAYLFENLELFPYHQDFIKWRDDIGEDGTAVTYFGGAASPMHHIQKDFLDPTTFFYHYKDHQNEMRMLAESLEHFFDQALRVIADSPAEVVHWGGNFDDMITYPPYFEKEILPWIRKASEALGAKGKIVLCHCDGENRGLMDLIKDSGMHVAEAVCPYPMTKVRVEQYYAHWHDQLTIFGGIPSNMMLAQSASEDEFEAYLDHLFDAVAPGDRLVLGIADTTPPNAVFDRLVRIGERVEREGRLPLEGGAYRPLTEAQLSPAAERAVPEQFRDEVFQAVREDLLQGRHLEVKHHVQELLKMGLDAHDILHTGLLSVMEAIGQRFKTGEVFIPEVLLSARAMNEALSILEPHLAGGTKESGGKVLIGTVRGDLHDIGKNMVATMLRGVGFDVLDMGVNLPRDQIIAQVLEHKPSILGLSALLTTTMPEMKKIIDALKDVKLTDRVKVMVGGAPVNERFASDIGADGYAQDAGEAVALAKKLMQSL